MASSRNRRYEKERLHDEVLGQEVLTQPAAIKIACDFARKIEAVKYYDAGDVQANGFQIVENETPGQTFTETGASYMGFAVSSLRASALAGESGYAIAYTGEGSFLMNPQILIDAVEHGVHGMILLFDNRRMGAISGLQWAQYGADHATNDSVPVDYLALPNSVSGVQALCGGTTRVEFESARATHTAGSALFTCPCIAARTSWVAWEPGDSGTWETGARKSRKNIRPWACDSLT